MTEVTHHVPSHLLAAYAMGTLPQSFGLVVATHISMCADCRAEFEAHNAVGGVVLEHSSNEQISGDLKANLLDALDAPFTPPPVYKRDGIFPGPMMAALKGKPPKWTPIGMGVRQCIIQSDKTGSARLLYIPPRQAVPDHSHGGLELTLVLQGSFHDATGRFAVGDLEVADQTLEHNPIAGDDMACICLAATDAPLRFSAMMPRLLQPFFRI